MLLDGIDQFFESRRFNIVICVKEVEILTASPGHAIVASYAGKLICLLHEHKPRVLIGKISHDVARVVRRPIVYHNDLKVGQCLGKNALQRLRNIISRVVAWNDYGGDWHILSLGSFWNGRGCGEI